MSMNRREFLEDSSKLMSRISADAGTASAAFGEPQSETRKVRLVDTEVHFSFPEHLEAMRRLTEGVYSNWDLSTWGGPPERHALFSDVEAGKRIEIMDKAGVDLAVLSLAEPGVQVFNADTATNLAALANDRLAEAIKRHPTRYAGFATFAPQDPKRAAKEIDRAINQLKLNALLVNSHTNGEYLDAKKFWPILEAAEAVGAPLYIHPRTVPDAVAPLLDNAPSNLRAAPWGFPSETSLHALRLIFNGIFEQFPKLKIVLGHMGEGLPFWRYRIDYWYRGGAFNTGDATNKLKKPSEYFQANFMITTSGMNSHPALEYCHEVLGPDQIMWASDYPYQPEMNEASEFINTAPLPTADVEKIAHTNAERFFHIAFS